jgi:WD40 repeat protein
VATGTEIWHFDGFSGWVTSLAFSQDRRFLVASSKDGTTRLLDAASGKWLAMLITFREGGWAVVDPEGHYDASDPDNVPGLNFVSGTDIFKLGEVKKQFYTLGLLARVWHGEKLPAIAGVR